MRLTGRKLVASLVLICCSICVGGQPQHLRREETEAAVAKISALLQSNYVFEDRGNRIAAHLIREHREGKFNAIKSWSEFASLCTMILQEYSNDKHLYVRHDPKTVKELLAPADKAGGAGPEDTFFHSREARERNFGFEEVKVLKGNVGYLKLSEINISEESLPTMFAAAEFVINTKALILDLRGNKGGGSEVGAVLESLFLPKDITLLEFKSRTGQATIEKTVPWLTQKRYGHPLFILIDKGTGSAAEALAFALQAKKRAIVVGRPSSGGAYMNSWYVVNDDVFVSVSTSAPTLPGTDMSWEGKGVQPDHALAEGYEIEYILRQVSKAVDELPTFH